MTDRHFAIGLHCQACQALVHDEDWQEHAEDVCPHRWTHTALNIALPMVRTALHLLEHDGEAGIGAARTLLDDVVARLDRVRRDTEARAR